MRSKTEIRASKVLRAQDLVDQMARTLTALGQGKAGESMAILEDRLSEIRMAVNAFSAVLEEERHANYASDLLAWQNMTVDERATYLHFGVFQDARRVG